MKKLWQNFECLGQENIDHYTTHTIPSFATKGLFLNYFMLKFHKRLLVLGLELGSKNQTQLLIQLLCNLIRTPEPTVLTPPQTEYPHNIRLIPAQHWWVIANSMLCWWVLQVQGVSGGGGGGCANPRFTLLAFQP
jgi:hypothetical protein